MLYDPIACYPRASMDLFANPAKRDEVSAFGNGLPGAANLLRQDHR